MRTCLCTEPKRQDLDGIADQESRPSAVVEDIVDEDENNLCIPRSRYSGFDEFGRTDCPDDKRSTHTSSGEYEKRATTKLVDEEARRYSSDEVDDHQDTVDFQLGFLICYTCFVENVAHVIRDETVSRPLGEEPEGDKNDQTTSITRSSEKIKPWVALNF